MVDFSGFQMPVQYTGIIKEHLGVRDSVGVFDVSHMGEFIVEGPEAINLLQFVCSNDISKLFVGKAQYNCLLNEEGGIIDDLIVYQLEEQRYLLVVNAGNIAKDWDWISNQNKNFGAQIKDISAQTSLLAIQGPKALTAIQSLTSINLSEMPFYTHKEADFAGVKGVLIATTGYTGSGGVEIYFPKESSKHIWKALFNLQSSQSIIPVGLGARDTLRMEMGYCLYGNELNDSITPYEAGLGWVTKPDSGFINADKLLAKKTQGFEKKLIAFHIKERAIPRAKYTIVNKDGEEIGIVTSGTMSPSLNIGIGLGYVKKKYSELGTNIYIKIREKRVLAEVQKLPFYKTT